MFSKRESALIAAVSASVVAVIGGGIAVAASNNDPASITALASPGPAAISALGTGPEIPSAEALRANPDALKDPVARAMANATVVRSDERIRVALGKEPAGPLICMSVGAPGVDGGGSTCQTAESIAQGQLWIESNDLPAVGVAPDGVREVQLSDRSGTSTWVPVVANTYLAPTNFGELARVSWTAEGGHQADLRISTTSEP